LKTIPKRYVPFWLGEREPTMPKLTRTPPKYRLHKASGQAVVTLDGRDHYLGPHGPKESRIKCDELVGGWLSRRASEAKNVAALPDLGPEPLVGEVLLAYKEWAQSYYRRNGKLSREYTNIIHALRPLATLYGTSYASSLDLAAFEAVQMAMVKSDLSRRVVNDRMRRIRSVIKWAASRKLIPADVLMAINGVRALRRGQYDVRETLGAWDAARRRRTSPRWCAHRHPRPARPAWCSS